MSVCEDCWKQASMHAAMFGGVAAEHYARLLQENDEIHPGIFGESQ